MNNWKQYQINTLNNKPRTILIKALKEITNTKGLAIDIGCGSGADTIYLIKKGWKVLAIDSESYGFENIRTKLKSKTTMLEFLNCPFEKLPMLPESNLIVANYSLPFCLPNKFDDLWNNVEKSLSKDGIFVGNFFGKNDDWFPNNNMTFVDLKIIKSLFKNFSIFNLKEIEKNEKTALNQLKHWHIFEVIAIKKA